MISLIRGDVDWIVMRCLEKDRTRRYETADGLAADIERHLSHQPVSARPPSVAYRLGKAIRRNKTVVGASAVMLIGAGAWLLQHRMSHAVSPAGPAAVESSTAPFAADPKSIALLPFANLSSEPDSEYFSDGMHEAILANLFGIRELRVIPRTSVEQYRKTNKPIRQIARELGVAYILEGTVRRAGGRANVTVRLVRGSTEGYVWDKAYERDLTAADIFAIQAALSTEIAGLLRLALSPEEKTLLERRPTENLAAYDLYLKARGQRYLARQSSVDLKAAKDLFERALQLDPSFVQAWTELISIESLLYQGYREPAELERAKAALDTAVRLAPDSPDVVLASGVYYYRCLEDSACARTVQKT